jgi:predicted DNA-binding protein
MAIPESNRRAINKYNAKNYDTISVRLPKELVQSFREKCAASGDSQAKIIKEAIEAYLNK